MSLGRKSSQSFHCQPLEQLDRQLQFAPVEKREGQLRRAEKLHDEIDAESNYPFDYLAYRITRTRARRQDSPLLVGEAVLPDLRRIIDSLSRSLRIAMDDEPTWTVPALAAKLEVSTKTIHRWRQVGLRWRWVVGEDAKSRPRVGITARALERFMESNGARVNKARQFTQLTEADRQQVVERAKTLAADESMTLNHAAEVLARETGRALETLRLLLEKHDRDNPREAIFPSAQGPLNQRQKHVIARAHRMGVSIERLCERFGRTRSTIYRAIHERRAAEAARMDLTCIRSPTFERDDAEAVYLRPVAENSEGADGSDSARGRGAGAAVDDLPEALRELFHQARVSAARQRSLFLRYNYLKFRASQQRAAFDKYEVRAADLDAFDRWVGLARETKEALVRLSLPTVLSVARRHLVGKSDGSSNRLLLLLEIGLDELLTAVDVHDARREQRFEAFVTNRLLRRFARQSADDEARARRRLTGEQALGRLNRLAARHGVRLAGGDQSSPR